MKFHVRDRQEQNRMSFELNACYKVRVLTCSSPSSTDQFLNEGREIKKIALKIE